MIFKKAETISELHGILNLQSANLKGVYDAEVEHIEGFVTLQHDLDILTRMNAADGHIIAVENEKVVGYALSMSPDFKNEIPGLFLMFDMIQKAELQGSNDFDNYLVMGQICVDKNHRGQGVFRLLYDHFKMVYSRKYNCCVTLVACSNIRSLAAHKNVGFETLYKIENDMENLWELVVWKW